MSRSSRAPIRRRPARRQRLESLLAKRAGPEVDAAQAKVGPDTVAKLLFTSGSTGAPKGVINTQRMMTSNQAMLKAVNPSYGAEPPMLIDWLPWSHTFGGNNNFNLVLANGGSYYIDEGKPLPGAIEETVQNLREISPTVYYNVPQGFEMLLPYLAGGRAIAPEPVRPAAILLSTPARRCRRMCARNSNGSGARRRRSRADPDLARLDRDRPLRAQRDGARLRQPGVVGIPNPGVEVKLVPNGDKLEARLKSPSITPGYWRQPELTKAAFDEEGYYKLGDALRFFDESDPERGFVFDGRVAEDFKLATGTWVSVGPLRLKFVAHCAPYVTDVVVAGHDRDDAAALVVPNLATCRDLAGPRRRARAPPRCSPASVRGEVRGPARRVQQSGRRQLGTARAHHPDGRSALARHRRTDRQGLDQPARRAGAPRRRWSKSSTPKRRRRGRSCSRAR